MLSRPSYLSNLTPLRGIAALMVVIFHFDVIILPLIDPQITTLHRRLYLMVDFFFILSGFIMYHVYGNWFVETVLAKKYKKYLLARFARIYPLHLFTLLWLIGLYVLLIAKGIYLNSVTKSVLDPAQIPFNLLMLHGIVAPSAGSWNVPSWSIGAEWLVYLFFPFIMLFFAKIKSTYLWLILILIVGFYWAIPLKIIPSGSPSRQEINSIDNIAVPWNLVRCMSGFLIGMITYRFYTQQWAQAYLSKGWLLLLMGLLTAASCHFQVPDMITVWGFPLIILIAAYNNGKVTSLLQTRFLQRLGDWSYSIYLVHSPVIFTALAIQIIQNPPIPNSPPPLPPTPVYGLMPYIVCLIFILIIIAVAALTYRFIEVPARKWINAKFESGNTQIA